MSSEINDIILLKRHQIDDEKWNAIVYNSTSGLIYATTQYLDAVSKNWIALATKDYSTLFPIPIKKKLGIQYPYTPFGISQLGIIGTVNEKTETIFIEKIRSVFFYGTILFNEWISEESIKKHHLSKKDNFTLVLNKPYHQTYQCYTKDAKKNLNRINQQDVQFLNAFSADEMIQNYIAQYGQRGNLNQRKTEIKDYVSALEKLVQSGLVFKSSIVDSNKNTLVSGYFGQYKNRIYYLFAAPSNEGRKLNITHLLIDATIKQFSESNYIFDFEGSGIPSVAQFYKKFSPELNHYAILQLNKFPFNILTRFLK